MKKTRIKIITILSFLIVICSQNPLHSAIRVSAQSGNYYNQNTWVGGLYPAFGDDIVISSGHTVTLDMAGAFVKNITIEPGATLDNGEFDLTILTIEVHNPIYSNNGIHNGPGKLIAYEYYDTEITGSGITNCNIEIVSYGLRILNTCNLTVNGNIQHSANPSWNMNGKIFIDNSQGGTFTVNGDIITTTLYYVGIQNAMGTLNLNGDVYLYGGSEFLSGSNIENSAVLNISGNLLLGDNLGYAWNHTNGVMNIGGDLLGSGAEVTYFFQDPNSLVRFGGSVFPATNDGELCVAGPAAEPNIVEYNGNNSQEIKAPSDAEVLELGYTLNTYSNLVINNSSVNGVTHNSDITVNGILTLTDGIVNLGSNNLLLNEGATIAGTPSADNMVVATGTGELRKRMTGAGSFTFPVGDNDGTAEYSPITIDFTAGTFDSAYVGVNLVNQAYPGVTENYINRYWNLSSEGITDFSCNTRFDYVQADVAGIEDSIYCFRMTPTTDLYSITNVNLNRLTATGISALGSFTGRTKGLPFGFEVTGTGSYCDGGEGLPVGLSGSETGVVYTLYKDAVIEASMAGTGSPISFGIQLPATYTISGTNDYGTTPMSGNAVITENPLPVVTWPSFSPTTICIEDWGPITLTGGLPEGGTYSGDGVTNNIFYQAVAGIGSHIITYTYSDENSCSNQATMELFVDACLGVTELSSGLNVYPNPASESFKIQLNNQSIVEVSLYNAMGIGVYEYHDLKGLESITTPVQNLPAGTYILKVTTESETFIKPIIIK
ncbi:MAG: T9SS type A sorting domain-containing protein [Bacteroidales bacterium]|nr:T9SS type A sorting domain-containing protein [Bacteroidales bacterium]